MNPTLVLATAKEIRNYLVHHPASFNTLEDVHTYWLNWGCSPEMLPVTKAALTRLEHEGFVESAGMDKQVVWRLHREKRDTTHQEARKNK